MDEPRKNKRDKKQEIFYRKLNNKRCREARHDPKFIQVWLQKDENGIKAEHFPFQCRSFLKNNPHLDIGSDSSDSGEAYISPLVCGYVKLGDEEKPTEKKRKDKKKKKEVKRSVSVKSHSTDHRYGNVLENYYPKDHTWSRKVTERPVSVKSNSTHHHYGNLMENYYGETYPKDDTWSRKITERSVSVKSHSTDHHYGNIMENYYPKDHTWSRKVTERNPWQFMQSDDSYSMTEEGNDMLHRYHRYIPSFEHSFNEDSYVSMEKDISKIERKRYRSRSPRSDSAYRCNNYTSSRVHRRVHKN